MSAGAPAAGEGKRGESGHLGYLLRQAQTAHRQAMEHALAPLGVTPPQFTVLTMLVAYPGASGADLARLSLLTPPTVSVIVANLERMGALVRTPHATHGRVLQIGVSAKGKQLLARCRTAVDAIEQDMAVGLTAVEETAVRRWLVRIAQQGGRAKR